MTKKFTFFWRNGDRDVLEGEDYKSAFESTGYTNASLPHLDFWAEGDSHDWEWNGETREWVATWKEEEENDDAG